eukprot:CAMPEP_0178809080 /NCGR_PEP_ID=MMETSP0745-20121128/17900_1 /TAXON_ID=913974 /ORGANISM="Nitzschia punctata, Strain CCMP561" /LENGTH=98 /DNA_ID=CAMNT_0020469379 /DNA_START=972 /DNA_END=1265 /DNA_ORIENTATION=-
MIDLSCHTARHAAEGNIRDAIDYSYAGSFSIPIEADSDTTEADREKEEAVAASNKTKVIFVKPQMVFVADDHTVDARRWTDATTGFTAHAWTRASTLS